MNGYKTYIAAAVAVISALAGYFTHQLDLAATVIAIIAAIQTAFVRAGVKGDVARAVVANAQTASEVTAITAAQNDKTAAHIVQQVKAAVDASTTSTGASIDAAKLRDIAGQ